MSTDTTNITASDSEIRPDVLNYDDLRQMVPFFDGKERLANRLLHWLKVDRVNHTHASFCDTPGPDFVRRILTEDFKIKLRIDNEDILDNLPQGAFITVSNHPFGALDGIILIHLIAQRRPKFKVMVNMILNKISAMRPNFIAVDAWASDDPKMRQKSILGIRQTLGQLRDGEPVGFFPAGAMSKVDWHLHLQDRPWQQSVLQIIKRAKVPVIPIFFHGSNSWFFNFLGVVLWQARSLRLPAEVYRKTGKEIHISVGEPISVAEQEKFPTPEELGAYLRQKTYKLRNLK